jgi:hypothetical protein
MEHDCNGPPARRLIPTVRHHGPGMKSALGCTRPTNEAGKEKRTATVQLLDSDGSYNRRHCQLLLVVDDERPTVRVVPTSPALDCRVCPSVHFSRKNAGVVTIDEDRAVT